MIINKKVLISILACISLQVFADSPSADTSLEQKVTNVLTLDSTWAKKETRWKVAKKKARKKSSPKKGDRQSTNQDRWFKF